MKPMQNDTYAFDRNGPVRSGNKRFHVERIVRLSLFEREFHMAKYPIVKVMDTFTV